MFTGRISRPRHEFQALVEQHGGVNGLTVTKDTNYLVVGEKPGSKLGMATLLGVKILSEEQFFQLLEDSSAYEGEKALSPEELFELRHHVVTRVCKWCHKAYEIWDNLPDYGTCSVCEILAKPQCSKCHQEPVFVVLLSTYYCEECNWVFDAPHSERVYYQDHIHVKGAGKRCVVCLKPCDSPIKRAPGKVLASLIELSNEHEKRKYSEQIASQKEELGARKWAESLTKDQRAELLSKLIRGEAI